MNNPEIVELTDAEERAIEEALKTALPAGPGTEIDREGATRWGSDKLVAVRPVEYPDSMFEFMQSLARAEIALRDEGMEIRLSPDIKQQFLVVANPSGRGDIAYLSTDGKEYDDLANILETSVEALSPMAFEGYPYDNEQELEEAIAEAHRDYPDADFSHIH